MSAFRSDDELREASLHVFWRLRQLLSLSLHLGRLRRAGRVRMVEPLDAAALEAFAINARALIDFIWRTRDEKPTPRTTDLIAVDWFEPGQWNPYEQPPHLEPVRAKVGKDIAHLTLGPADPAGWQPQDEAHSLASAVAHFAMEVPAERVARDFRQAVEDSITEWRIEIDEGTPVFDFGSPPPIPVASPSNVTNATELRAPGYTTPSAPDVKAWRERQKKAAQG
ncbi:MAG TPA: hypothetical protein VNV44_05265 [Solirubrobacteraceae bacterium]|nr:hypothetical protein [Solirubrobacteraceae bacterium]